jgi:hypothetical protein
VSFEIASLILLVAALGLGWLWWQQQRRAAGLANLAHALAGHADAAHTSFGLLQQAAGGFVQLAQGGDNSAGVFANMDSCPCRQTYTCATDTIQLNAWPNPNPNPVLGFPWNAPPRERETWDCPGNCVIVPIKIWRGWVVVQLANGQILMHIHTFTQYHCKEPDDPDINKPPEGWELPPKPKDINA